MSGTNSRYFSIWKQIGISKERYLELLYFCMQLPEWIEAERTDPKNKSVLLAKIGTVNNCARAIDGGKWQSAIIKNVCFSVPYTKIGSAIMPSSRRSEFYEKRRDFFRLLNKKVP